MIRYLRVTGTSNAESRVVYYANKPRFVTDNKIFNLSFGSAFQPPASKTPVVFNGSIVISVPASTTSEDRYYEAKIEIADNQPTAESVAEVTTYGVSISVYNENGVKICDNGVTASTSKPSSATSAPGEMTSVPGEMASETTDEPGAMI